MPAKKATKKKSAGSDADLRKYKEKARAELKKAKDRFKKHEQKAKDAIKNNPEKAVAIAAGIGAAMGAAASYIAKKKKK